MMIEEMDTPSTLLTMIGIIADASLAGSAVKFVLFYWEGKVLGFVRAVEGLDLVGWID